MVGTATAATDIDDLLNFARNVLDHALPMPNATPVPLHDASPFGAVDHPLEGALVQRHGFRCDGWFVLPGGWLRIEAIAGETTLGSTTTAYRRPDVLAHFGSPAFEFSGFTISCAVPEGLRDLPGIEVRFVAVGTDRKSIEFGRLNVRFSEHDYRQQGHGGILGDGHDVVLRKINVFGSGPPSPIADTRCIELIERYVSAGETIVDIGCGIGAYGRVLTPRGYDWTGVEVNAEFVHEVHLAGLPAVVADGPRLPFDDDAFDVAICIEVLEHIDDYPSFIAEIRRVTKRIALFSVPNYESIPVMAAAYAIPWHMLDSDHKSFFTRRSLTSALRGAFASAEAFEYGPLGVFRAADGLDVYNHLFAVASVHQ